LPATAARPATKQDDDEGEEGGLQFRLSEITEPAVAPRPASNPTVAAEKLSEAETRKLLARLPALGPAARDEATFNLRERSLPPPRAGETIQAAFAPQLSTESPSAVSNAPLEVTRFAPEGEVALVPNLTVTFSQPMIAVSSQAEAAGNVPVRLAPEPPGKWRWLGTQTLMFQPETEGGRLPMATSYQVTIPAGTKSALGNTLRETKTFSFATPPPQLENSYPEGDSNARDSLIFLQFDQRIEPAQVLQHLKLLPAAGAARLRLAQPDEIAANVAVSELVKRAPEGRWLVLRAVDANGATKDVLPPDTLIKIVIASGTGSAEGARATVVEQSFTFRTFGLMRVREAKCGYQDQCSQFETFQLAFSNQIDTETFQTSDVKVEPELPDVKISVSYKDINIQGAKRSNTTYTVTLNRTIKDTFNQPLSGNNVFTFKVNDDSPSLFSAGGPFVVLDPAGSRALTVYSNKYSRLRVMLYKVTADDWVPFRRYLGVNYANTKEVPIRPGRLVSDQIVDIGVDPEQLTETAIDVSAALDGDYGHVFVRVEPVDRAEDRGKPVTVFAYRRNLVEAWVESTEIALDAFVDQKQLVAWTNSLKDGSPLGGVAVSLSPDDITGATGANGLARLAFKSSSQTVGKQPALLVARRGKDVAILPKSQPGYSYTPEYENQSWRQDGDQSSLSWYVFDDRKLYRPGEEINIKGWVRKADLTPTGDLEIYDPGETLNYVVRDSQGNKVAEGRVKLNALAGFNFKALLPATMNLGRAYLKFKFGDDGEAYTHVFQVQEFRRPEFEITTRASEAPHFVGSSATVTMTAAYYTGGGLADTEVAWNVLSAATNYTPPNREDYIFGKFQPWWLDYSEYGGTKEKSFAGRTDALGRHTLKLDFDQVTPARPSILTVAVRVQDVNRQALSAATTLLVHPADVYVGLKSARNFVQKGEAFDLATIVTDLDGKALSGREVRLRLVRLDYIYEKGKWKQEERDPQEQTVKSSADAVHVRFQPAAGGTYRLTAQVRDERERLNETELGLWVAGGNPLPRREVSQEKVELIPDRRTYADNDVAEILVQSPFAPAEGVLTIRRSGLLRTERFMMSESSYTLRVPIAEAMTPNIQVQVDLVGAVGRVDDEGNALAKLPPRPAFASGEIKLEVPPVKRHLFVTATPRDAVLEPGAETFVEVEVKDANGRAVAGTDTAVIVVDESVLALTNYQLTDPLKIFYAERDAGVDDYHLREQVTLANPEEIERLPISGRKPPSLSLLVNARTFEKLRTLASYERSVNASYSMMSQTVNVTGSTSDEISARKDFNALAVFAASLPTDANGRVRLKVKLPDNLTRYRVMAVSVAGGKLVGTGESVITARKQLMARPSAPRFLNYGDAAELPVVLQNQSDQIMNVNVAVRASNANLTDGAGRRVAVPANNRVEVHFPIAAAKAGTARFQIVAATETAADAAEISLPIYTPATTEAFATYGVIDKGSIAQPVKAPADVVKEFGGLEVTTASTQLQELTDAVLYLVNYPYACTEQLASRVIAIAALKDVLAAFKAKEMPAPKDLQDSVNSNLKLLEGLQNSDGGFGFWRQGETSFPYVSVHVAHALVRARSKGFTVPKSMLEESQKYLREIEKNIPAEYSGERFRLMRFTCAA
jgi:hypothetical protein